MTDIIYLVALVLLPLLLPALVVSAFLGNGSWLLERLKTTLTLHEERGLAEQGLLWISIISPFLYFIALGVIAWRGYSISLTEDGLKVFFSISTLPLGALSLSLPLSILVSRLHATKQTAKQIKITNQKTTSTFFILTEKNFLVIFARSAKLSILAV